MLPPNDVRYFVHKRIIGAVGGFLTGGVTGAIGGAITGGRRPSGRQGGQPVFRTSVAPRGLTQSGVARGPCRPGTFQLGNRCVDVLAAPPGGRPFTTPVGTDLAIPGSRGVYAPELDNVMIRRCFPGDVLGRDGNCYPKGSISNKMRAHPKGRRPLGTPGEMAALAKAASFGRRMETTVKRMQKIGVLKKPRRGAPRRTPRALGPIQGGSLTVIDTE